MAKSNKGNRKHVPEPHPQTSIPGAVGSIFAPRDEKTGEAVPTFGKCSCGNDDVKNTRVEKVTEEDGVWKVRRCNDCGKLLSGVRPAK
jgi:hypothetical protein